MLHNSKDLLLRTANNVDRLLGTSAITLSSSDRERLKILAGPA